MDEELLGYFKADSLIVKQELVFGEDASFTMSCTEESKTGYVSDIKKMVTDGLNQYFADLMAETAKEEGITVEDVMKAYEVDSLEGVFKAQMGMTIAEFVNQLLPQETLESLIDATSASGTYEVKDGSLSLAMDGVYVTAVYDAEAGTVTMDADGSVFTKI